MCGDCARAGLEGAIAPRRSILAPRWKVKTIFLEIFGIYSTLKKLQVVRLNK